MEKVEPVEDYLLEGGSVPDPASQPEQLIAVGAKRGCDPFDDLG